MATRLVLLCGHDEGTAGHLAKAVQGAASATVEVWFESAIGRPLTEGAVTLCVLPSDLTAVKKLASQCQEAGADFRVVLVMRDPRDMLIMRPPAYCGLFSQGFDHSLHRGQNGIMTLSLPGVAYTQTLIEAVERRMPEAVVVRREDLRLNPRLVRLAMEALTGISLGPSFEETAGALCQGDETPSFRDRHGAETLAQTEAERLVRQFRLSPDLLKTLWRWGYEPAGDRSWLDDLSRRAPAALDDRPGTIVAYYTRGTRYEDEARRLEQSALGLSLPLVMTPVETPGTWLEAVRLKPGFLLEQRRKLRGPLLYVDADAYIHSDPWRYLRGYGEDVAVAGHRAEAIISGTVLINDTPGAVAFLEDWIAAQARRPDAWDQHTLEEVCLAAQGKPGAPYTIGHLPPAMCRVFDRRYNPPIEPVIEHLQASRELKAQEDDATGGENLMRRRKRLAEIDARSTVHAPLEGFAAMPQAQRRAATTALIDARATDIARWSHNENLLKKWSGRAAMAAGLLGDAQRVLDLGCGAMDIENHLRPGTRYLPADVVKRDARTILIDLNKGDLPSIDADAVVMLGVLEYLHDPQAMLGLVAQRWGRLILSYHPVDLNPRGDRRSHGWFNDIESAALVAMAGDAGLSLDAIVPVGAHERLYSFRRAAVPS